MVSFEHSVPKIRDLLPDSAKITYVFPGDSIGRLFHTFKTLKAPWAWAKKLKYVAEGHFIAVLWMKFYEIDI